MAAKAKRPPKRKEDYVMSESIPAGEILTDIKTDRWILGKLISVGGFEEVYSAAPYSEKVPKDYLNIIKIEPLKPYPILTTRLLGETYFYKWVCKLSKINNWQKKKKLAALGVPRYIAFGNHEYKNINYQFLVIDRYGKDLQKIFKENSRQFPEYIVYKLALQIIDILEYIHHNNYVHADIKGENLLLDLNSYDQVYLVDFGLVSRITELKVNPQKAHYGTLQYTSRDAHMGDINCEDNFNILNILFLPVPTKRGDLEILSYNMILWLCGSLPWEKWVNPVTVQIAKEKAFKDIDSFLNTCFHRSVPQAVQKFMALLPSIKFNEIPPYEKFKEILTAGLKKLNHKPDGKLGLNSIVTSTQQNPSKSAPQKIKGLMNEIRKSPRTDIPSTDIPSTAQNPRTSTIGVVMDKKRCNVKDIEEALNDMDFDSEYDVQILRKAKKTKIIDKASKITENTTPLRGRKKVQTSSEDSEDDFQTRPLSKRLNKMRQKKTNHE